MKICPTCKLHYPNESTFCFVDGATLDASSDPAIGATLGGRFSVESLRSETAVAQLYDGRHTLIDRAVIVKLFRGPFVPPIAAVFDDTIALGRRCGHPNVAPLVAGGVGVQGRPFVVSAVVDGKPLDEYMKNGKMDPGMALSVARQALSGLSRIHDLGAVHGSIRPGNVLMNRRGHVTLIDVGVGRVLAQPPWAPDPAQLEAQRYLAPELDDTTRASAAADLYALGVLVHTMLAGAPYGSATDVDGHRASIAGGPAAPPAGLAEPLATWLASLLAADPTARPGAARVALKALDEAVAAAGVSLVPDPGPPKPSTELTLSTTFKRWPHFRSLFEEMVKAGFPGGAPAPTRDALANLAGRVETLNGLGKRSMFEYQNLQDIEQRGHESRERIAQQMRELDQKEDEVRAAAASQSGADPAQVDAARNKVLELHAEVLRWEGKSRFEEPLEDLSRAYREIADAVDAWWGMLGGERAASADVAAIEAQRKDLREAMRIHESNVSAEIDACERAIAACNAEAEQLEPELLDHATRFSSPLRSKPELGPLFRKLKM